MYASYIKEYYTYVATDAHVLYELNIHKQEANT